MLSWLAEDPRNPTICKAAVKRTGYSRPQLVKPSSSANTYDTGVSIVRSHAETIEETQDHLNTGRACSIVFHIMCRNGLCPEQEYNLLHRSCPSLQKHLNSMKTVTQHPTPSTYPNASFQAITSPLAKHPHPTNPPLSHSTHLGSSHIVA